MGKQRSNKDVIYRIFKQIFESKKPINERIIIKQYGKVNYNIFSQYFRGGYEKYVLTNREEGNNMLKLTPKGIDYFLKIEDRKENKEINLIHIKIVAGTAMLAISSLILNSFFPKTSSSILQIIGFIICFFLTFIIGISLIISSAIKLIWSKSRY